MSETYKPRPTFEVFSSTRSPTISFWEKLSKEIDVYTPPKTKHDNGKRPVFGDLNRLTPKKPSISNKKTSSVIRVEILEHPSTFKGMSNGSL